MTVAIQDVSLIQILESIKKEKGIWFDTKDVLPDKNFSMHFENFSVENALRRLLAKVNYVLFFDHDQKPVGIMIFGSKNSDRTFSRRVVGSVKAPAILSNKNPFIIPMDSGKALETNPFELPFDPFRDPFANSSKLPGPNANGLKKGFGL